MLKTRKLIKIGSSMGVTLPKESLIKFDIKLHDTLYLYEDEKTQSYIIKKYNPDDDIISWADKTIEKYKNALVELKDK